MILNLTAEQAADLGADLEGRGEVYRDDGDTAKEAATDAALAWVHGIAAALTLLNGELEAKVPAEHEAGIGLSLDNLAERRERSY